MKQFRTNRLARVFALLAIVLFILPLNALAAADKPIKVTTAIKYKPIDYFVPEKRIKLSAKITDKAGVNLARCYFRAVEEADFVFVAMQEIETDQYEGILPAPSKDTETIEYLFLVVNGANQVVKSQRFKVNRSDDDETPAWQEVGSEGDIHVTTELPQATEPPPGFSDSIVVDVAESSARFGLAAGGIYTISAEAGGATGTAASSTSGGTVSASSGMSTMTIVGIGAAVAAVAGIGVAVGGSSSGNGSNGSVSSSSGSASGNTNELNRNDFIGTYAFRADHPSGSWGEGTITLNADGSTSGSVNHYDPSGNLNHIVNYNGGLWSLNGTFMSISAVGGGGSSGNVNGDANQFTLDQGNGWVDVFTKQ